MENTLGLNVHGSTPSQAEIQPSDTSKSIASSHIQRNDDDHPPEEGTNNATSPESDDKSKKEKGRPYVPGTPPARAKMSPEELTERMEKIRLQNEKIKERREHVKADEEAFNTSVAFDRAKQAANRKVQAQINQNREQNARRKLEKMANREWDSGKQGGEWKQGKKGKGNPFSSGFVGPRDREGPCPPANRKSAAEDPSSSAAAASYIPHGSGSASSHPDPKEGGQE